MVQQQGEAGGQVLAALSNPPSPPSPRPAVSRAARPRPPHHQQVHTSDSLPSLFPIPHCVFASTEPSTAAPRTTKLKPFSALEEIDIV